MTHLPVNHHLRPLFRVIAGLAGLYVLVFGIVAFVNTGGVPFFAQENLPRSFGLQSNRAFALLSIVAGIVVFGGAVIGRNLDRWINLLGGIVFLVAGLVMIALLRTDLNVLGFAMTTCVVSFIIGMVMFVAGLYGYVGTHAERVKQERFRRNEDADPELHPWDATNQPPKSDQPHRFA